MGCNDYPGLDIHPHYFDYQRDCSRIDEDHLNRESGDSSTPTASASAYTFNNYQDDAGTTAIYPDAGTGSDTALSYVLLGLIGEIGELANKYKKVLRDNNGVLTSEVRDTLGDELSDCCWYIARLATELDYSLGDIANHNIAKLRDRNVRGVIGGSGDNR